MFETFASESQNNSSCTAGGMPDLLLWHPQQKKAKLSEVKGPRDRLSDQQRAWIAAIAAAGMAVEVCKFQEPRQARDRKGTVYE